MNLVCSLCWRQAQHDENRAGSVLTHLFQLLVSWGSPGVFFLAVLDSIGVPMIGGVDALLITYSTVNPAKAYLAALNAIVGSLLGSSLLFFIARKGGQVMLEKYTMTGRGRKLRHWFEQYGLLTIFVPAISPIPMPLKIPVFCAGALEVRLAFFLATLIAARTIRYLALAFLGQHYGTATFPFLRQHWLIVLIAILSLCGLSLLMLRLIDRVEPEEGPPARDLERG
jgi:membrane protein YqaA with SNARE-associated domain